MPPSLKALYEDPKKGLNFKRFWASAKSAGYENKTVHTFLEEQSGESRFRDKKVRYHSVKTLPRQKVGGSLRDNAWQVDLIDMTTNYKHANKNFVYILCVIDCHSRYIFLRALKTKDAAEVLKQFKDIVRESKHGLPVNFESDNGSEFKNKKMQAYLDEHNVTVRFSPADELLKGVLVERVNGSIRKLIGRYWEIHDTFDWLTPLQDIASNYNNSKHTGIKATPQSVYRGNVKPYQRKDDVIDNIHYGDAVRIRNHLKDDNLGTWKKSNLAKWSEIIYGVIGRNGYRYILQNEKGDTIKKQYLARDLLVINYTKQVADKNRGVNQARAKAAKGAAVQREEVTLKRKLRKAGLDPDEPVILPHRTRAAGAAVADRVRSRRKKVHAPAPRKAKAKPTVTPTRVSKRVSKTKKIAHHYGVGDFVLVTKGSKKFVAQVVTSKNQKKIQLQRYERVRAKRFKAKAKHTPWIEPASALLPLTHDARTRSALRAREVNFRSAALLAGV